MCQDEGEEEPLCVQACPRGCLTFGGSYEAQGEVKRDEMETVIRSLIAKYGLYNLVDYLARMAHKANPDQKV